MESPTEGQAPEKDLLHRKLALEVGELEAAAKARWTRTYWPIFSALVAALATSTAYLASRDWDRSQERKASFERSLNWATDTASPARQVAGATALGLVWGTGYDNVIASTLASLLGDQDAKVRGAAVAAFDQAINGNETARRCAADNLDGATRQRIELLYGDGNRGTQGIIPRQIALLQAIEKEWLGRAKSEKEEAQRLQIRSATEAAKEAIRVNRECLRSANLRGVDLSGLQLYQANLQNANLLHANLAGTHLRGSDLSGALLRDETSDTFQVWIELANIKDMRADSRFKAWALENSAVEMDEKSWMQLMTWRSHLLDRTFIITNWFAWQAGGFKVDRNGWAIDKDGKQVMIQPPSKASGRTSPKRTSNR